MPPRDLAPWLSVLHELRTTFGPGAAGRTRAHLARVQAPVFADAEALVAYHDTLLFLRAHPHSAAVAAECDRRLRAFGDDVARYRRASGDGAGARLADSGLVDTSVSHVYSFRLARALAARHGRAIDIDWDAYWQSDTANLPIALVPAMLWHESDAVDNDEAFDERAWLERNLTRATPTCLTALLRLFATSGLPERVQEHLYDQAEVPLRWDLTRSRASRTWARVAGRRRYYQTEPMRGRSKDLRAALARRAAPLERVPRARAARYVDDIHDVLASRVRELYPLAGASIDEVYHYTPGRGLEIVVYGSVPAIRLPHETNMGAMFVRNGVPIGYGVGALLFERAEMAINVFPAYRNGESAFLIEEFFRLFVHHFGARTLVVSAYQVGDGNDEGLDSGAFWFYYKLGFRPVRAAVRTLAERQATRIAADPSYRTSRAMLRRLAKSDMFFTLDPAKMGAHDDLPLAQLGYAVTRHVARAYAGDRAAAVAGSIRRLARQLPIAPARWSEGQRLGAERLAPLLDALGSIARWPRADRITLAQVLASKGGTRERDFVRSCQRVPRLAAALRRLADREAARRPGRR